MVCVVLVLVFYLHIAAAAAVVAVVAVAILLRKELKLGTVSPVHSLESAAAVVAGLWIDWILCSRLMSPSPPPPRNCC